MREQLRQATEAIHAGLDQTVGDWPISSTGQYIAFLCAQHAARTTVESALAVTPPEGIVPPPAQSGLIACDLLQLGAVPTSSDFALELDDPFAALGAAWVLAGSSLGNRAMLTRRRKAGLSGADRFLADQRLATYFGKLLEVCSRPHDEECVGQAIRGATDTFNVFEQAFADHALERSA